MSDTEQPPVAKNTSPGSLAEVIADLRGFGIEEFEEILTIQAGKREIRLKIANLPTEDDLTAITATEDKKGYVFFQEIKI